VRARGWAARLQAQPGRLCLCLRRRCRRRSRSWCWWCWAVKGQGNWAPPAAACGCCWPCDWVLLLLRLLLPGPPRWAKAAMPLPAHAACKPCVSYELWMHKGLLALDTPRGAQLASLKEQEKSPDCAAHQ
jgi:hypothetical protein